MQASRLVLSITKLKCGPFDNFPLGTFERTEGNGQPPDRLWYAPAERKVRAGTTIPQVPPSRNKSIYANHVMIPNGNELSNLLSPYSVHQFIQDYWGQQSLFIPGENNKFTHLDFSLRALEKLIRSRRSGRLRLRFVGPDNKLKPPPRPVGRFSLRGGNLTICADWISDCFQPLASYCGGMKAALNFPGSVFMTCYASPDGHGLGTHFDCHPSFILQIEGTKRWRFSGKPAVQWPPANLVNAENIPEMIERYPWIDAQFPDPAVEAEFLKQELSPGDALYLPAGTWHTTHASGYSVALTMTCIPMTAADFFSDLMRGRLSSMEEWRCDIPPIPSDVAPPEQLPHNIKSFFQARTLEVQKWARSLSADDLFQLWTHHVHSFDTPFNMRASEPAPEITETDILYLDRRFTLHYVVSPTNDTVTVYHLDNRVDLSYAALPFVEGILNQTSFAASEAVSWLRPKYTWSDTKHLLVKLVGASVLRIRN